MLKTWNNLLLCVLPAAALLLVPGCGGGGGEEDADAMDMSVDDAGNPDGGEPAGDPAGEDILPDRAEVIPDPPEDGDSPGELPREIWRPSPGTSWQWQLTGTIDTSLDVQMYDIDLFDAPGPVIAELHSRGIVVICYFSAGSYEEWREDASSFPTDAIGNPLEGWPDSVDGYTNDPGFPLTYEDQIDYNTFIAGEAHARGLSVGLKNDLDQIGDLLASFDWALDEECFTYDECGMLAPFIDAGKAVFQVEYGDESLAATICPRANALNFDTLIKNLDLDAWRFACR
jgi:hypothetical protein